MHKIREILRLRWVLDPVYIHSELRRPGVTLELLHIEYLDAHPECYRDTALCDRYRAWQKKSGVWMRQVHRAGEKTFVDYSGKRPSLVEPGTGERVFVELFVGMLGVALSGTRRDLPR